MRNIQLYAWLHGILYSVSAQVNATSVTGPCAVVWYVYKVMGERPDHLNHTSSKKGLAELSGR